jgi:calcineurin-like phosphoesterase family protein
MTDFITSDLHLSHGKILKYFPESRPFNSKEEMNEDIIKKWNCMVQPKDTTYILGDVAFCHPIEAMQLLDRLNGKKILIVGNHDHINLKEPAFRSMFESIHDYLEIKRNKTTIVLFHYPIYSWNKKHYGSIMLHGHSHGRHIPVDGRIADVGLDTNNCFIYNLNTLVDSMLTWPIGTPDEEME